ncbi:hypothetical protein ACFE04_021012 [Oxalis oulophora]
MNKSVTGWIGEVLSLIECANKISSSRFFVSIIGRDSSNWIFSKLIHGILFVFGGETSTRHVDESQLSAPNDDQANKEVSKVRSTSTLKPKTSTIASNPASYVAPFQ